jgi:prolyl-tRNA synthetase
MTNVLRMSELYAPTLKEDPTGAELASHRLMLRAGYIRKMGSGLYSFLPLGMRVLNKITAIVNEEIESTGAQQILLPFVQPAELWHQSGRWNDYGPELARITDRHGNEFCLGPTHEEIITALVRSELRSYKQLPTALYQSQIKFRDEIRPRFGLMRSREFVMNDTYSFHATQESLSEYYEKMGDAYGRICDRLGLKWRGVEADTGQIGGKVSREYMALADAGEAELVYCECGYAADTEAGACHAHPTQYERPAMEKIATPGVHTIDELSAFLDIPATSCMKAFSVKDGEGKIYVLFVPGDHEVNEIKGERVIPGFTPLTDEEMVAAGLHKGSMGPVGLPEGVTVVADESLKGIEQWAVGANEDGFHYVGARLGSDFTVDVWADLCLVSAGDSCPECGKPLESVRGIEVSQIFQLGTKYSEAMGATFMAEDGSEQPFIMGCYGVGVTRAMAAIIEQCHDENGIYWPMSVAPAHVCVVPLTVNDDVVAPVAEKIAQDAAQLGFDVVIDDRKERAGVKFNDADLIGWPLQIVVGKRGIEAGTVEVKLRRTGERKDVSLAALNELMRMAHAHMKELPAGAGAFEQLFGE